MSTSVSSLPSTSRNRPRVSLACARTHGSSATISGSNAGRKSVGSRSIRSSGAANPRMGWRDPLRWVNRCAFSIHSWAWYWSPAAPEVTNSVTMVYASARASSDTSPSRADAAMASSVPSARCPLRNQYQPAAPTSRIASCAQPRAIASRRAALMLSCSASTVASHPS
ncbi:hypothetical protein ACFQZ4_19580 [Catellatospora coxensis]